MAAAETALAGSAKAVSAAGLEDGDAVLVSRSDAVEDGRPEAQAGPPEPVAALPAGTEPAGPAGDGPAAAASTAVGDKAWLSDDGWKDLGQASAELGKNVAALASTAGKEVKAAAQELTSKIAGTGLNDLSSKLSTWWTALDPPRAKEPTPRPEPLSNRTPRSRDSAEATMQTLFRISPSESLIEAFPCTLVQTYQCTHNVYTADMPVDFGGTLYISDKHVCFHVSAVEKRTRVPVIVEHTRLTNVSREKAGKSDISDTLKLSLEPGKWFAVKDFAGPEEIESAHALLEHLVEAAHMSA
eukprot:SM000044S15913  [mRNA]  locus=s44:10180:11888:+ [translate_table: standard]